MNIEAFLNSLSSFIWGPFTLSLLFLVGLYLMIGLKAYPLRNLNKGLEYLFKKSTLSNKRKRRTGGDISSFESLMTALSATVGTGNIAGVATAIFLGGPGAIFWMWLTALVGMATKYAEAFLAIVYREKNTKGNHVGGPMYYIKNGLGQKYNLLAYAFAFFGMIAAFGIGNGVQSNSVAQVISMELDISRAMVGFIIAILVMLVIIGGIQSIGRTAAKLVPAMSLIYILGGLYIIVSNFELVPTIFWLIIDSAFNTTAASGGFAGATVWAAIRYGVSRGVFSNEAGLGSSPIAHAAAKTNDPKHQGSISMLEPLIDTLLVCTITAFVILISQSWYIGYNGAALTTYAFDSAIPGIGKYIVIFGLVLFAFSTIIGWSYYGEKCAEFLFGEKVILYYRILWVVVIPIGASVELNLVWLVADIMNGLMALPNLIALLLLSPIVFKQTMKIKNNIST